MLKKELLLDGLNCPNCSAQIEHEVNEIDGINAQMNFMTKTLTLEATGEAGYESILKQVRAIVRKHEPDVVVKPKLNSKVQAIDVENAGEAESNEELNKEVNENYGREFEEESSRRNEVIKLAIGGCIFVIGIIFQFKNWLELLLFITSYIIVGGSVVKRAVKGILHGQVFSEHFLMSVATIGAFFIGNYPEGVSVMLFYLVGEMFQDMAVDHSRKSISTLMDIRPDYANLKIGDELKKLSPDEVKIGDVIVVKPGEKIPLDGKVIEGSSMVDTAALTGESVPRELVPGSDALSGFINKNGVLTIEVIKNYGDSTVSKILDLVQNASCRKAPTEQFITRFARYYTPLVVFGAMALAILPPIFIPGAPFSEWVYRALAFLVVSCPCALVISIPLGFFGGIGGASKRGILVKGSNYLEALNYVEVVVFDKTGTLTKGVFKVTQINPRNGYTDEKLLEYASYAESYSSHPIARSILDACKSEIDKSRIGNFQEVAGLGIKADIDGNEVLAGNSRMMDSEDIEFEDVDTLGSIVHIAVNKVYAGNIIISDELKEDAGQAIPELKSLGIRKAVMLTGDLKAAGDEIGKQLGMDEVYSELLPGDKVEKIESLEREKLSKGEIESKGRGTDYIKSKSADKIKSVEKSKGKIIFVGDGINDAPVLARADIGIAMGALGSDAAIEAADIVIMDDAPSKIATAIKISKRTRNIVYQNIAFAMGVKALFLALSSFGMASMWEAVFADMGVALIAIFNAMRVINTKNI